MNKKHSILLAFGMLGVLPAAQAQVTVYGKVDMGMTRLYGDIPSDSKSTHLQQNHASRIGFKGSESLGNGLSVIFQLESRFKADTGDLATSGVLFGGPAFVGIAGDFGSVTAGRNLGTVDTASTAIIDPFWGDGVAGLNEFTRPRVNNSITYTSPDLKGFQFQGQYMAGEKPIDAVRQGIDNDGYAVSARYSNGPLQLTAGYGVEDNTDKTRLWTITGAYQFAALNIALGYDRVENRMDGAPDIKNYVLAGTWSVGRGLVKVAYNKTRDGFDNFAISGLGGVSFDTINKYSLGYQHNLSRRTSLYADIGHTRFENPGQTQKQTGLGVGITHDF